MADARLRLLAPTLAIAALLAPMVAALLALEPYRVEVHTHLEALLRAGIKANDRIDAGELYRLMSAGFIHVNAIHFLFNAVALALCGALFWRASPLAARTPARAFVLVGLALVSSAGGFLASYLVGNAPSCGASAAVFGLLGASAGSAWTLPLGPFTTRWGRYLPASLLTALGLAMVAALLPVEGVDHAAHLGGYGAGLIGGAAVAFRASRVVLGLVTLALFSISLASL
jgi:membrane associated rhomboid family serine protease